MEIGLIFQRSSEKKDMTNKCVDIKKNEYLSIEPVKFLSESVKTTGDNYEYIVKKYV